MSSSRWHTTATHNKARSGDMCSTTHPSSSIIPGALGCRPMAHCRPRCSSTRRWMRSCPPDPSRRSSPSNAPRSRRHRIRATSGVRTDKRYGKTSLTARHGREPPTGHCGVPLSAPRVGSRWSGTGRGPGGPRHPQRRPAGAGRGAGHPGGAQRPLLPYARKPPPGRLHHLAGAWEHLCYARTTWRGWRGRTITPIMRSSTSPASARRVALVLP